MPDPAHEIKSLRKMAFKHLPQVSKKFVTRWGLKSDIVDFQHVKNVIEFQEGKELQIAPHLSKDDCVDLGKFASMDCGPAIKVCSRATGSAIEFMHEHYGWSDDCLITAKFCHMVGRWYAYMSGRNAAMAFLRRNPGKNKTIIEFLEDFCEFMATLKIHKNQKKFWLIQRTVLLSTASLIWLVKKLIDGGILNEFMGAKTLGDVIENLHSLVRAINPYPPPILYLRIVKGISMSQFLGTGVKKGSYGQDISTEQLIDFDNVKALCLEKKEEAKEDEFFLDSVSSTQECDFSDIATLALVAGYFLRKVIKNPGSRRRKGYKCEACINIWIEKPNEENQLDNSLIDHKEFKKGAMTRPSVLGNKAFFTMESLFLTNRDTYKEKKRISDLIVKNIVEKMSDQYDTLPLCHLEKIVRKYVNCRIQRWGKFQSKQLKKSTKV